MTQPSDTTRTFSPCPSCGRSLPAVDAECPECEDTRTDSATPGTRPTHAGPKQIAGYRIIRELGAGGMGTVFEAFDEKMGRRVALKVLSRHIAGSEKAEQRFSREAWIAGKLNHPNLVKVFERGTWEEFHFYSMELVRGGSLGAVIKNMKQWGRDENVGCGFGSREYVHWVLTHMITVARGLDYAHREGVVHRDIKPMNLLLSRKLDTIKIADFGLAIDLDTTRLTTEGKVLGTLVYMAPEQILGKQGQIDARTDIFALGATLFELLTLERPYTGKTHQMYMNSVLTGEARRPSRLNDRVSRDLEIVIRKALEKDRKDRYGTAALFADDLDNVLHFRPIAARPPGLPEKIFKWARRKPIHAVLAATLLIGVPAISALGVRSFRQHQLLQKVEIETLLKEMRRLAHRRLDREAIGAASQVLRVNQTQTLALRTRALSYMYLAADNEDPAQTESLQNQAMADISRIVEILPRTSWPRRTQALILEKFGRKEDAAEAERLGELYRSDTPGDDDLYFDGRDAAIRKDYLQAVAIFSDLHVRRPDRDDALIGRADAYEELGEIEKAIADFQVAAALNPGNDLPIHNLGRLYTGTGSLEEGERYYRRVIEIEPELPYGYEGLSDNLIRAGQEALSAEDPVSAMTAFEMAELEARKSLERKSDLPISHMNLGVSLVEQNRLLDSPDPERIDAAIEHYERAISIWDKEGKERNKEDYGTALVNRCDALIESGELDRAERSCLEVAGFFPEDADAHYNLAGVYAMMNRPDDAIRELQIDFELGDTDHEYLSGDSWFDSLHGDPRFDRLLDEMREASGEN